MKGFIIFLFLLTACSAIKMYDEINIDAFNEMLDNKNDFVLFVDSNDCRGCDSYRLTVNRVVDKYNIDVKYLNVSKLSKKDRGSFIRKFSISKMPVIIFFDDGVEKKSYERIVGNLKYSKIVSRLKDNNYIKG